MNSGLSASGAVNTAMNAAMDSIARTAENGLDAVEMASAGEKNNAEVRKAFDSTVGQIFYGQMLKAMRKTVGKPAYFHGGKAEEIFQEQLDQVLGEKLAEASAKSFTDPMFKLFSLQRR